LPNKEEVRLVASTLSTTAEEDFKQSPDYEKNKDSFDFSVSEELISACLGLSHEEMENALALSLIEHKQFNVKAILDRKRQIIKSTGFMDFMQPEPIENLGGLDKLKEYISKRIEAFEDNSIKPKLRSILLVGIQGCGKSLASKCIASIFDWPLISLDIGSIKGGIVGETEKNVRLATKTIDAFGRAVIQIEEIEKALSGSKSNLDSGVSAGLFGHLLTWFQERHSEGILIATANDLTQLPPEMLRAGRWDTIFFVDTPNEHEVKVIVEIMNRRYQSNLPTDEDFCKELAEEQWTGAEIEQLAKDSHFDELDVAMNNIPLLSSFRKDEMDEIRKKAKQFRAASSKSGAIRNKLKLKKPVSKKNDNVRKLNLH
jgi:SpoVK/Ycf46/Vps4 family AAA+-type ATPase